MTKNKPRLFDLLMDPAEGVVVQESDQGTLVTDRFVVWELSYLRQAKVKGLPTEPGRYEVGASKPPHHIGDVPGHINLRSLMPDGLGNYMPIMWSTWFERNYPDCPGHRLGSLGGEPVAGNDRLLQRLPDGIRLYGKSPGALFALVDQYDAIVGACIPVRIRNPTTIHTVMAQTLDSFLRDGIGPVGRARECCGDEPTVGVSPNLPSQERNLPPFGSGIRDDIEGPDRAGAADGSGQVHADPGPGF